MQVDEDKIPPEQQHFRDGDAAWEMVRDNSLEVSHFDPLLDPRNPADPRLIAVRMLHYHPEHIGEKEAACSTDAAPKTGALPCETRTGR